VQLLPGGHAGSQIAGRNASLTPDAPAATVGRAHAILAPVTNAPLSARDLRLVVGYDGSPPAARAVDAAVNLLQGRTGRIEVVYVAHMPTMA
jgi:Universal stress protein family